MSSDHENQQENISAPEESENWPADEADGEMMMPTGNEETVPTDEYDTGIITASDEDTLPVDEPDPENISAAEGETKAINESVENIAANDEENSPAVPVEATENQAALLAQRVASLQAQEQELRKEVAALQATRDQLLELQVETQTALGRLVKEGLSELEQRKQALQITVEQLERRQERIRQEMRTTFAGVSQDLAIRVQGFKDYLVGSLQDLASSAEQLELAPPQAQQKQQQPQQTARETRGDDRKAASPKFAEQAFQDQAKQIRRIIDQYRNTPDYYGPPWQLRRTFEPIHAERVSNWFFSQGGRGALRSMGSRLQNILVGSSVISVLRQIYGGRLRTLVLANSPERLGEWRRGLQDCLGITRTDFGPERGVVLFEAPEPLVQKAERLLKEGQMPLVIIDETEDQISLSLLQFPLWLAFAPEPQQMQASMRDF